MSGPTFVDLFCGAGGSISGLVAAGFELVLGANHWERAIETVSSNYGHADFLCTDINHYDMRRLPPADVLWASVICTEMSPGGGNRKYRGQLRLDLEEGGHVPSAAYERTRACALDVVRATEVHRYRAIVVENVVEFARDWELYQWWITGMRTLGYRVQVVNASAAHMYGEQYGPAPQWRDRIYIVFTQEKLPAPDLNIRPLAWCPPCEVDVESEQRWKRPDRSAIGKYGQQYLFVCPRCSAVVEPYVAPAIQALDLTNVGTRIGDRSRPLSDKTRARVQWGLEYLAWPVLATVAGNTYESGNYRRVWPASESPLTARQATGTDAICGPLMVNHGHTDTRAYRADSAPLATRTAKIGDGILRPFVTVARQHQHAIGVEDEPLVTLATGRHQFLTTPPEAAFYVKNFGGNAQPRHLAKPLTGPLGAITTRDHHALVIPYRKGNRAQRVTEPLSTLSTRTSAGVLRPSIDIDDCYYRTLTSSEHLAGQYFDPDYIVKGNEGERTMQAGNAVAVNAARLIGDRLLPVLA